MHKTSTEQMKLTSCSEISQTIYHNSSYLLLIEKSQGWDFKVSYKWFFLFWSKPCNLKTLKLNKCRGCLLEEKVTGFEYILALISFDCNQIFESKVLIIALLYLGFRFRVKWFSCSHSVNDILAFLGFSWTSLLAANICELKAL